MTFAKSFITICAFLAVGALLAGGWLYLGAPAANAAGPDWSMNATTIEACTCPMFCQCYFNTKPAGHHGAHGENHFCRFNMGYQVNTGSYGTAKLDGAKFWIAGDLGSDFSKGQMDWAVLTFDPSVTKPQREGIQNILGHLFPVKWASFSIASDKLIDLMRTKDRAEAKLDGGNAGIVVLNRFQGNTAQPVVIQNLKYWGATHNDGFILMPNEVQAYRLGDKKFESKGTNGFLITVNLSSKDVKQ
jgi:hypothetical protein